MIRAIIFDFDGIIADTEPTHLEAFKRVLHRRGIELSDEEYYGKYLAYDDKTLFEKLFSDRNTVPDTELINEMITEKNIMMKDLFLSHVELFPGVLDFLQIIKGRYILAIGSGALKSEIIMVLNKFNINDDFANIIAADDVDKCKPAPDVFLTVLDKINKDITSNKIYPNECLVFEDSVYGIEAAKSAEMNCIAITNTYSEKVLGGADLVVDGFESIGIDTLEKF